MDLGGAVDRAGREMKGEGRSGPPVGECSSWCCCGTAMVWESG